jgi:hypothetical protein
MSIPLVKFIPFKVDWIPVASEGSKSIGDFGIQIWRICGFVCQIAVLSHMSC